MFIITLEYVDVISGISLYRISDNLSKNNTSIK
jgi:hypothetical protein